jgi:hypothetical protein
VQWVTFDYTFAPVSYSFPEEYTAFQAAIPLYPSRTWIVKPHAMAKGNV